jgi:hypothetical protein
MPKKKIAKTKTRVRTSTVAAVALLAGAGLAAAAGMVSTLTKPPTLWMRLGPVQGNEAVVRGAEDATLLAFDLRAQGSDARIEEITFSVFGDLDADFASGIDADASADDRFDECVIEDSSGMTVSGPEPVSGGLLAFSDAFSVPNGATASYALRCDLSNEPSADGDADRFAASIAGESSVVALDGNGAPLSGSSLVIGKTAADTLNANGRVGVRVEQGGRLAMRLAPDAPSSDIVLGGASDVEVGRWEFHAFGESFLVEQLSFDDLADGTIGATATLRCDDENGDEYVDTATFNGGHAGFEQAECFIPASESATVSLSVDANPVGSGPSSGDRLRMTLNALDNDSFAAVGTSSGEDFDDADLATLISAREMTLRQSEPAFTLSSSSPSGPRVPGFAETLAFHASASAGGDVAVRQLLFRVVSTDNASTGWNECGDGSDTAVFADAAKWTVYDDNNPSVPLSDAGDWTFFAADGSPCGTKAEPVAYAHVTFDRDASTGAVDLAAGSVTTLGIFADTSGASAGLDDAFQLSLVDEPSARNVGRHAVIWDDGAEASDVDASLLESLPVTGGTLTY